MMDTLDVKADRIDWEKNRGACEATDLGLPPGRVPMVIRVTSPRTGAHRDFLMAGVDLRHGEVRAWRYLAEGVELTVFND